VEETVLFPECEPAFLCFVRIVLLGEFHRFGTSE
jgi:hypothetical protein